MFPGYTPVSSLAQATEEAFPLFSFFFLFPFSLQQRAGPRDLLLLALTSSGQPGLKSPRAEGRAGLLNTRFS